MMLTMDGGELGLSAAVGILIRKSFDGQRVASRGPGLPPGRDRGIKPMQLIPHIEIIGIYPVEAPEPVHLIELWVRGAQGVFNVGDFTQELPTQPWENWQTAYDEQILDAAGSRILTASFEAEQKPELWHGDIRMLFFFHYLESQRPLRTPFGEVQLPPASALPARLSMIRYEPP